MKYSPKIIEKAKKMVASGLHSERHIARELGFSDSSVMRYHTKPGEKEKMLARTMDHHWKNREHRLSVMRKYSQRHPEHSRNQYSKWMKSTTLAERRKFYQDRKLKRLAKLK